MENKPTYRKQKQLNFGTLLAEEDKAFLISVCRIRFFNSSIESYTKLSSANLSSMIHHY